MFIMIEILFVGFEVGFSNLYMFVRKKGYIWDILYFLYYMFNFLYRE